MIDLTGTVARLSQVGALPPECLRKSASEGGASVQGKCDEDGIVRHIGQTGQHELRFGAGIMAGNVGTSDFSESPFAFCPEIYYVWHQSEYFALQAGIDLSIAFFATEGDVPAPIFNVFLGFRI